MGKDVEITFDGELSGIKDSLDGLSSYVQGWGSKIKSIGIAAFAAFGVHELIGYGEEFIAKASEAAQVDAKLASVLESSGHAAGFSAEQLTKLATSLEHITLFDDEAVKGAETMIATFSEIRGDQFEKTTKLALDMATVMGGDASSAASELGKALNDPIRGAELLARQGVLLTQSQKDTIEQMTRAGNAAGAQNILLGELQKKYGGAAEAAAGAAGGGFKQLANIGDDIKEALGNGLLAVIDPLMPLFKQGALLVQEWAEKFAELGPTISDYAVSALQFLEGEFEILEGLAGAVLQGIGDLWATVFGESATGPVETLFSFVKDVFKGLLEVAVGYFTLLEVEWNNLPLAASFAWNSIKLGAISLFEDLKHFFTETGPELVRWFFDNWRDIFTDLFNFTATIFANMGKNIGEFFANVYSWLSGGEADWHWTNLEEGFKSTLRELPNIVDREMTATEKALAMKVGQQGAELGSKFHEQYKANMNALGFDEDANALVSAPTADKKAVSETKKPTQAPARADRSDDGSKSGGFEDLGALFKRIQSAAAGGSPELKAATKTADATEATRDHSKRAADASERSAAALEKMTTGKPGTTVPVLGK